MNFPKHIKNVSTITLSNNWHELKRFDFDIQNLKGHWEHQQREVYYRGNGAVALLYDAKRDSVILIRQFRLPALLNGHPTGYIIECCAGMIEGEDPEACMIREIEEETGYAVNGVTKIFESYMSPGVVNEKLYFYLAAYDPSMKLHEGGGLAHEQEETEVLEVPFSEALNMIASGAIEDAKTIMLLQQLAILKFKNA